MKIEKTLIALVISVSQNVFAENPKFIVPDCQLVLRSAIADIHMGIQHPSSGENVLLNVTCSNITSEKAACAGFYARRVGFYSKRITDGHFRHLKRLTIDSLTDETLTLLGQRDIIHINWSQRRVTWEVGQNKSTGSCEKTFSLELK